MNRSALIRIEPTIAHNPPDPNPKRRLTVRIEALGEGRAIVDGREKGHRFLRIGPGAAAELSHLRLQHFGAATTGDGGRASAAVLNEGALRTDGVAVHSTKARGGRGGAVFNAARARALLQRLEVSSPDGDVAVEEGVEAEVTGSVLLSPCPNPDPGGSGARVTRCFDAARDALGTTARRAAVAAALGVARDEGFEALIVVDTPEDRPVGSSESGSACRAMDVNDHQGVTVAAAAAGATTTDAAAVATFLATAPGSASSSKGNCSLRAAVAEAGRSGAPTLVYLAPAAVHAVTEGPMRVPADAFIKITGGVQPRGGLPVVDGAGNNARRLFEVEADAYLEVSSFVFLSDWVD